MTMTTSYRCSDAGILVLSGFMGSGKSSVGKELSALLSCPFIDLDQYIESHEGRTIPEIFSSEGEHAFRALERLHLHEICASACAEADAVGRKGTALVLALGGGTLTNKECARIVAERTFCVYLRATTDTLVNNLKEETEGRPMLSEAAGGKQGKAGQERQLRLRIEELMSMRRSIYESSARLTVDIDGRSVSEIAALIKDMYCEGNVR